MAAFFRQTRLVATRELLSLLSNPLYYILCGVFFLLSGTIYLMTLIGFSQGIDGMTVNVTDSVVRPTFYTIHFFLLVQIPLMTMRSFAEDRASGMLDLLQTTPLGNWALLLGKFFGTVGAFVIYLLFTVSFPLITGYFGEVEWPVVFGSIIALLLCTGAYVAIGVFCSSLTESQVTAAVLAYVVLFCFAFADAFTDAVGAAWLREALRHFAVNEHLGLILDGNLAFLSIVYFAAIASVFLFLTARWLEATRWRA